VATSRLRRWLSRIAPVHPGEGPVVAICLVVNLLVVAGIMFGRNARDSLFLIYFGVQYLPIMYFANAAFLVLCSIAYTTLVDRIERGKFLAGVSLIFVAGLIVSRVVLLGRPHWFFPVLYIEAQVVWYFSLMQFWTFAGDLFDTRQAKRLFPFLAVGALLGMIGVGVGSKKIVHTLGTENLLLVWAGLIVVSLVLGGVAYRRYRLVEAPAKVDITSMSRPKLSEWQKIKGGFNEVGREPLLRSMAGYILLLWTVYAVVDFCFNKTMRARYPDPNDLTTFFGIFIGVQGFLCLVIQLFFVRAVISRLGVGTTINFHPGFLLAGTAWMSLGYGYASVLSTKLGDASMLYTFSDSSYQLLYNPVSPDRRARVRGFIEGYIRPLSLAAAGALVLLGNSYLKPLHFLGTEISTGQQLAWGALIFAGVWFAMSLTAKKGYIRALLQNLQAGSPALRQAASAALGKIKSSDSLSVLAETLRSASPDRVVAAIRLLEGFGGEDATEAISGLLNHPDAHVRATAAIALGRLAGEKYADRIAPLLSDPDPRVRSNAVEALAFSKDPKLVEKIKPLLQDPSTRARVNTILSIAAIQGVSEALEWLPAVQQLARGDSQSRSTATYALGRLPFDQSMDLLSELLRDPEPAIRSEAAKALGRIGTPRVIPALLEALAGPSELRRHARKSLGKIARKHGEETLHELARLAEQAERPEIRSELGDVLGRLRSPQVIEPLMKLLKDPEWRVRWKVLKALERLERHVPLPEQARLALFEYAHEELAGFRQSLDFTRAIAAQPTDESARMLAEALVEDRLNIEERVFRMLGILCGREKMSTIFQKLQSHDSRLRADALEALDSLAPKKIAREVLELLEPAPVPKSAAAPPLEPALAALARHPKPWVRASTAFYLGHHALSDGGAGLLRELVHDRDPVVRETALYAGWRALRNAWLPEVESAAQSADTIVRRCAEWIKSAPAEGDATPPSQTKRGDPMLLTVEKVLFLKSAPVFAGLEGEELAAVADIALEKEYAPGEILFEEGQIAHHLYIVVSGKVEIFRKLDSKEYPLALLGPRECVGEMAILDDEPRSASVRALEPTTVLKIDRDSFRELIHERPQISFAIFKILSGRLRSKNMEVDNLPTFETTRNIA
jgi:HEAT repeat protein